MIALAVGLALPLCKNALPATLSAAASSVFRLGMAIDEALVTLLLVMFLLLAVKWAVTNPPRRPANAAPTFSGSSTATKQ